MLLQYNALHFIRTINSGRRLGALDRGPVVNEIVVSVIIPNYNGRDHLEACLSSLGELELPRDNLELIVVDNASTDDSIDFLSKRFPNVIAVRNKANLGFSRAANIGAEKASGEYVAFLNNDMRVEKTWLSILVETAESNNRPACVGSKVLNWDGTAVDFKGREDDAFSLAYEPGEETESKTKSSPFPTFFASGGAALFRREVFRELNGFDPDFFLYHEDVDLGWRLWLRGYQCLLAADSIVFHRGGASSGKLASSYIQTLVQTHALSSLFKNLERGNLETMLPEFLYFLLKRSRWLPDGPAPLASAIEEFKRCAELLIRKRKAVQSMRTRSDREIFDLVGNPINFLLRPQAATGSGQLNGAWSQLEFDSDDADAVRSAINEWLNQAHFLYETQLVNNLKKQGADLKTQAADLKKQAATIRERDEAVLASQAKLSASEKELLDLKSKNLLLAADLSAKTNELNQFSRSLGGRMLRSYGPLKYKYLLPIYRTLKLPPYNRPAQYAESIDSAVIEELPIPLESNAFDVVCLPIIDWDFRFQRPQQLMARLAADGHRVFYLKQSFNSSGPAYTIEEKRENVYEVSLRGLSRVVYRDLLDQGACELLFESLDNLRRDLMLGSTVSFVQLPFWWPIADKARAFFGWPIVYDCMDHHASFTTNESTMVEQESELLASANLVVVSSHLLRAHAEAANQNVLLIQNACDYDHFSETPQATNKRPLIGYYGAIADWFDSDLVADLAERRPDWDFVLVGSTFSADTRRLSKLSNVELPGEKHYADIPNWLGKFDVAIIPFKRTPLTEATNPVKAYEILAAGKPIVSVPVPEMQALSKYVRLAGDAAEFEKEISAALTEKDPRLIEQRQAFARQNTWQERYKILAPAVRETFPKASIIVVTYNNLELNRLCLESLYGRTEWPRVEVIVVDNDSQDGTPEYLKTAEQTFPNLRVILNGSNLGFAAANNIGLREASGDYLVLLNNDTVVTRNWLSTLIRHLQNDPSIGLIGPVTNAIGNEARIEVDYPNIEEMPAWAANWIRAHDGDVFAIPMLAMFCVAMSRETFTKVGPLDEQFGVGLFEDDDYTHRIKKAGLRTACAADVFIHHFSQAAFKKLIADGEYQALFDENRRRYEQKWNIEWEPHRYA